MTFNYPATRPYIPETIRVHLGYPESDAENVTVNFVDYIKNSASSELYPDWPEEALYANIYAIITFAVNRVFTEWYPSRGYDFDITGTTQYDQAFVNGRNYFDKISRITDEIFDGYLRKSGQIAPLFSRYCDGIQTVCEGLSQWGSVDLANQGMNYRQILEYYYGDDIEIVENVPILNRISSYPGSPLSLGDSNVYVRYLQIMLNKIRETYTTIPPIPEEDGVYGSYTEASVKAFQKIFNLQVDGITGKATWYSIVRIFVSMRKLAELNSLGISYDYIGPLYGQGLSEGQSGFLVELVQYYLNYIASFNEFISSPEITGTFDEQTVRSVKDFQLFTGLEETGIVDYNTGLEIYNSYVGTYNKGSEEY